MSNKHILESRFRANDEFYTPYRFVARELSYYTEQLRGKSVYCNCDDYRYSQFVQYFVDMFKELGLKKLTATCYCNDLFADSTAVKFEYNGDTS